jgi:hypothetical protein
VTGFQLFDGEGGGLERRRCERFEKSIADRLVDADAPNVEALKGAPSVELVAIAIVSRGGVRALISDMESTTTVATDD